jgi:hypothetical protein
MIMTSAVEARTHAVAPESIAIHFTCDEHDFGFALIRYVGTGLVLEISPGSWYNTLCGSSAGPVLPDTAALFHALYHRTFPPS